jgi:hypothetical protein
MIGMMSVSSPWSATLQGDDTMTTDASHPISVQEDIATFIVAPEQEGLRAAALTR